MLQIRRSDQRGHANHGWLDSYHTFSFANYYDPAFLGFSDLRVINEDRVQPGRGFGAHSHRDMEIISYVLEGALEHRDSMGNSSVIRPGDVQRMTAGTGVTHSEYNASSTEVVHFLQIWLLPDRPGYSPGYEQKHFPPEEKRNKLRLIASPDGRDGSVGIHQDACLYSALLDAGAEVGHEFAAGRNGYLHLVRGAATVNGRRLQGGDGVAIQDEACLVLQADEEAEALLFDLR
ncbi:MAG TPA: pirin family protein [Gammaproteobacteria bacterium]|jgi:redox-sensitive bicupin YhaK (pirin superfamily)